MRTETVVEVCRISKSFGRQSRVLCDVSLTLKRGEMVALIGASGSGKSTLIRTIGGLIPVDAAPANGDGACGVVRLFGLPMQENGRVTRHAKALRARTGVIFQQFNLVPRLSVLTNVCIGSLGQRRTLLGAGGYFAAEDKRTAMRALDRVGIAQLALQRGSDISGGQQQRAAIARTLVQRAELLLADEPLASLDPSSSKRVMNILSDLNREDGITVLVSLHQVEYAIKYCPRTIALRNGAIVYDGPSAALGRDFLNEIYGEESEQLFVPGFDAPAVHAVSTLPGEDVSVPATTVPSLRIASSPAQIDARQTA
ncbi:phosphonate ABC transporter, ATPase subunit [Rhodomicrobium vannielii ATCC 17100]|uniref:Phosphonate ABC transporter, ATPase subunit n=1 Tax=Rhodomicrobium vannielii (strain ATCC 17100 / DSM 162 / LMG 4299 / NCIMB 10020 / ATH 3.1.1) TaxID=648757 RepID=E3I7S6_RHOVT|nr:phosphonate ABC transporter ATP-binding protein [Rhodomicrobium vannielii]ADP70780.1 phosphonate ABC transporter, ATPase subunit [Rhodomicrobium vannielii ATCC 17100]